MTKARSIVRGGFQAFEAPRRCSEDITFKLHQLGTCTFGEMVTCGEPQALDILKHKLQDHAFSFSSRHKSIPCSSEFSGS